MSKILPETRDMPYVCQALSGVMFAMTCVFVYVSRPGSVFPELEIRLTAATGRSIRHTPLRVFITVAQAHLYPVLPVTEPHLSTYEECARFAGTVAVVDNRRLIWRLRLVQHGKPSALNEGTSPH